MNATNRAGDVHALGGHRRLDPVSVRAQVRYQPRHHQTEHVYRLRHGSDGAPRTRYGWALAQCECGREVIDTVDVWALSLREPTAAVRAQALQKTLYAFRVQRTDR